MNLDLLKIDEREKFQAYFDLFVTHSFFDNDNDNERHLLPKLYKENQTIIQVHNST